MRVRFTNEGRSGMPRRLKPIVGLALGLAVALLSLPSLDAQNTADQELASMMDATNVQLASESADFRVAKAEYFTLATEAAANTVLAKDVGNKQLADDFVPNDPRRAGWSGQSDPTFDDITYAIDGTIDAVPLFGGLTAARTDAAIVRAMNTWNGVNCSTLPIVRNPIPAVDVGLVAFLNGLGGSPFIFADVQHAGWRDINFQGGILAVTFTLVFVGAGGVLTDIDGNGKPDVAVREIYYDPSFSWADDGVTNVDVETVALHEAGHGLSQAHFGKLFIKNDGSVKASPRAVMNAGYLGPQRTLRGTDNGGHCSNWANWPNQ
jgi:hypothetical protein